MRKKLWGLVLLCLTVSAYGQEGLVRIEPSDADGDQQIKVIYDAALGATELTGASKVYMHSGVITAGPEGESWQYVVGNWGSDDGVGQMTPVDGSEDVWEITLAPTARDYYSVPGSENIFRLSMVFRNADGSAKGSGQPGTYSWGSVGGNGDIYINLNVTSYVQITEPTSSAVFIESGESINFAAEASADVTTMRLLLDTGSGLQEVAATSSGTTINYEYTPAASGDVTLRVEAEIAGEMVNAQQSYVVNLRGDVNEAPLPSGVLKGINYIDDNTVVLALEAPFKDFVYVVGDFTNWDLSNDYLMFKDPSSDIFWLEVDNLDAGKKYVFQYWVDGEIKIGDPYADEIADADNDPFIPASVHPDIAPYSQSYGPASVLQTAQAEFAWDATESTWTAPAQDELIVYELLVRDFLESHSYNDLIDTLGYLKRLGVNAIELMPVMEFEGNISWGYNPSYFFAVDKYYGTKNDFKRFVEAAHANGMAVIMDMVLNHAFGQNSLVQMYFDLDSKIPTPESPWFNQQPTHPFNVGYDFNHESSYTQDFVDSVNAYWLDEYHIDGYRFDLSKGFTQTVSGNDVDFWSSYDASRVALLKRMSNEIWEDYPESYVILEHFADGTEESELAAEGMLLWRNMHYTSWESLTSSNGNFSGANALTHVSYMESHDEERITFEGLLNGRVEGDYSTKDITILLERHKMNAAFFFMLRGPKMLWQFGELGYDIELNDDRLAPKPFPWGAGNLGYYEDELRQYLFDAYSAILTLRKESPDAFKDGQMRTRLDGAVRYITFDGATNDIVILGNFDLSSTEASVEFTETGTWYDYFSGEEIQVDQVAQTFTFQPGEFHVYTNERRSDGFPGVVEVFASPVTVTPAPFTRDMPITIRFDATQASVDGTAGLVGADKVFLYSGVVKDSPSGTELANVVDGAAGEMTRVAGETDIWEITLTPSAYYSLDPTEDAFRLGMYFRNEAGDALGKGFRNSTIYQSIEQDGKIVMIEPADFSKSDEITITFDARFGGGELFDSEKVYMHSGVVLSDIATPGSGDWDNVVGEWGQDNGVGLMSEVAGEPGKWRITLTPEQYYSLSTGEVAYWLSMVFRNADGTVKASTPAGEFEDYYVAQNGDLFYTVPDTEEEVVSLEEDLAEGLVTYPNPASNVLIISSEIPLAEVFISDLTGRVLLRRNLGADHRSEVDINRLPEGWYFVTVYDQNGAKKTRKMVISR